MDNGKKRTEDRPLIVALDVPALKDAVRLVEILSDDVDIFKVGIAPFTAFGQDLLEVLEEKRKKVFLDLKFHDIPNTVRNAVKASAEKNVFMMNVHCSGGDDMMKAAALGAIESAARPLVIGVTVLTSKAAEDLPEGLTVEQEVVRLARKAKEAGLDGVVASAREARAIKDAIGEDFLVVTPGVRPAGSEKGDQKRTVTPGEAVKEGADYIVVGRPIIQASDPARAARDIIRDMG